jgi:hypothetical protein
VKLARRAVLERPGTKIAGGVRKHPFDRPTMVPVSVTTSP